MGSLWAVGANSVIHRDFCCDLLWFVILVPVIDRCSTENENENDNKILFYNFCLDDLLNVKVVSVNDTLKETNE
jgi:hypothetical protein